MYASLYMYMYMYMLMYLYMYMYMYIMLYVCVFVYVYVYVFVHVYYVYYMYKNTLWRETNQKTECSHVKPQNTFARQVIFQLSCTFFPCFRTIADCGVKWRI